MTSVQRNECSSAKHKNYSYYFEDAFASLQIRNNISEHVDENSKPQQYKTPDWIKLANNASDHHAY